MISSISRKRAAVPGDLACYLEPPKDFIVDLSILSGKAWMQGPVEVGGQTRYRHEKAAPVRVAQSEYDLDGDGEKETTHLGRIVTE
ncbi:MAG: hypothetical protein ABW166_20405 [Sedimenticola sp.]